MIVTLDRIATSLLGLSCVLGAWVWASETGDARSAEAAAPQWLNEDSFRDTDPAGAVRGYWRSRELGQHEFTYYYLPKRLAKGRDLDDFVRDRQFRSEWYVFACTVHQVRVVDENHADVSVSGFITSIELPIQFGRIETHAVKEDGRWKIDSFTWGPSIDVVIPTGEVDKLFDEPTNLVRPPSNPEDMGEKQRSASQGEPSMPPWFGIPEAGLTNTRAEGVVSGFLMALREERFDYAYYFLAPQRTVALELERFTEEQKDISTFPFYQPLFLGYIFSKELWNNSSALVKAHVYTYEGMLFLNRVDFHVVKEGRKWRILAMSWGRKLGLSTAANWRAQLKLD